jgi:outer membrane protein assembly factor BamD (BamD/ComL family)
MMKKAILISSLAFAFLSCKTNNSTSKAAEELKAKEKVFYTEYKEKVLTKEEAKDMIAVYNNFIKNNPRDKERPEAMLRLASVYQGTKQYFMALDVFDKFSKRYPKHPKSAFVSFMKGFVCDLAFTDSGFSKHKDFAINFYQETIKKYPNNPLAKEAKAAIEQLDKTKSKINYEN